MILTKLENIWSRFWRTWRSEGALGVFLMMWALFWMRFAGLSCFGRFATRLATWFTPPFYGRYFLAHLYTKGYISPSATIHQVSLRLGAHVFIGDRVLIYQAHDSGPIEIDEGCYINQDTIIQSGDGGSLTIGANTHILPRCQFSAYKSSIKIGCGVSIAPNCAFYPYDHGIAPGELISRQPLQSKGGIVVEDNAWLGFGVIVLDGVRIGKGAVVGAGAVVTHDIPDGAIAVGVPARVVKMRSDMAYKTAEEKINNKRFVVRI